MSEPRIACVLVPRFAVMVERRGDPGLTGAVVIGGYPYERKPVYDCSEEAAACGVEAGISLRAAHDLCPEAIFLPADEGKYARSFHEMLDLLGSFSPIVEGEEPGRCFLDVRGLRLLYGDNAQLAKKIGADVRQRMGLTSVVGVGGTRFVAQAAALLSAPGKPIVVPPGAEKEFLSALPTTFLSCSPWMLEHLARLGIQNIGELAALPANTMMRQFGLEGVIAHRLANGSDERVVRSSPEPEELTASRDLEDVPLDLVERIVPGLIGVTRSSSTGITGRPPLLVQLTAQLREQGQMCQQVVLTLERDNGKVEEARAELHEPTCREDELRRALEGLWRSLVRGIGARRDAIMGGADTNGERVREGTVGARLIAPLRSPQSPAGRYVGKAHHRASATAFEQTEDHHDRAPTRVVEYHRGLSSVRITLGDLCREHGKVIRLFREGREWGGAEHAPSRVSAATPLPAADSQIARVVSHVQTKLGKGCLKQAVVVDSASRLPERRFVFVLRG